jgi:hypothetical protein
MWDVVKVRVFKQILFHVENDLEGRLFQFGCL